MDIASIDCGDEATSSAACGMDGTTKGRIWVTSIGSGLMSTDGASGRSDVCLVPSNEFPILLFMEL